MRSLLLTLFSLLFLGVYSQNSEDRKFIQSQSNISGLENLKEKFKLRNEKWEEEILKRKLQKVKIDKYGRKYYLSGFNEFGEPVYDYVDNLNAAITARAHHLWAGGKLDLELTGKNVEIGHWEPGGAALIDHLEYSGRVTHAYSSDITDHATHTAATMIGSGIKNTAKGMASEAKVISFNTFDNETEMTEFALKGGILSNHSYGTQDWISEIDSKDFGIYNLDAAYWDEIVYNAPYFLICKSAGNFRAEYYNSWFNSEDDGFDLMYTLATSKNILTAAAVEDVLIYTGPSNVVQSSFTSWGPTDDWRIKPDIATNGVELYSALSTKWDAYGNMSGTSMAAPTLTGTIALLQQQYHDYRGQYMRAATVRALVLGTTDEVGEYDGPDFQSGWGLLNAERASKAISNIGNSSIIDESTIKNDSTNSMLLLVEDSCLLTITVAWTDPKGTPGYGHDNLEPILINDLDMRLYSSDSIYYPWYMEPNETKNNFTDPAKKGDNFRDNIEKIETGIPAGKYLLSITHKGQLYTGKQDYSLVITGAVKDSMAQPVRFELGTVYNEEQGEIILSPDRDAFDSLTTVIVYAEPKPGWAFDYWSGDISNNNNPTKIFVDEDKLIEAHFVDLGDIIPVANAGGDYFGFNGYDIMFNSGLSMDEDGQIVSYFWDFGEGATSTEINPKHQYSNAGIFNTILTVIDNDGYSSTDTAFVYIEDTTEYAKAPYYTGFEDGKFDQYWIIESSNHNGLIEISQNEPKKGDYHLELGALYSYIETKNETQLKLNLNGLENVILSYWLKGLNPHDSIFISDNGGRSFVTIKKLYTADANFPYQPYTKEYIHEYIDLSKLAMEYSLDLTNPVVLKINQYITESYLSLQMDELNIGPTIALNAESDLKLKQDIDISIYPNPAAEYVIVDLNGGYNISYTLKLFNITGTLVKSDQSDDQVYKLDISDLQEGIYVLHIELGEKIIYSEKLIINKI